MAQPKDYNSSITSAALIIGAASLLSRILGLLRDRVLAGHFGAGDVLDAYYLAFRIPDFIYNLIFLGAISAGFIPIFSKYLARNKDEAWKLVNTLLNGLLLSISALGVLVAIFANPLVHLIAPTFIGEKFDLAVNLTRIIMFSPILLGISSLTSSVLQTYRRFVWYSLPPIFYNLGIIFGATVLVNKYGPIGLGWGVLLGAAAHFLIQTPGLFKTGYKYQAILNFKQAGLKELLVLTIPRTLTLGLNQISLIIVTFFASTLASGNLAVFNFANNLVSLPVGIIGISYAIAIFPVLTSDAVDGNFDNYRKHFSNTVRQIMFFILPMMVIFILLRVEIVRILLGSGRFGWNDTLLTMQALGFFTIGLLAYNLTPIIIRAFYALEDTKTPLYIALSSTFVTAFLSWLLVKPWRIVGLSLAYSIDAIIETLLLLWLLKRRVKNLNLSELWRSLIIMITSSAFMAVAIQLSKNWLGPRLDLHTFLGIFGRGVVAGVIGLIVYLLSAWLLKSPELYQLIDSSRSRMLRVARKVLPIETEAHEEEVLK